MDSSFRVMERAGFTPRRSTLWYESARTNVNVGIAFNCSDIQKTSPAAQVQRGSVENREERDESESIADSNLSTPPREDVIVGERIGFSVCVADTKPTITRLAVVGPGGCFETVVAE